MVYISKSPERILVKAIFFPSGETTASASYPGELVNFFTISPALVAI